MPMAARLCNLLMPGIRFGEGVKRELLVNGSKTNNDIDSIYLKKGVTNSFFSKLPRREWDGKTVSVFAQDGKLKDTVKIQLLNGDIDGFYSWQNTRGESMRTVEFITSEKPLAPKEKRAFRYKLSW